MSSAFWQIEGYDGVNIIYSREVKFGCFSEQKIQDLLKALAAKAGLNHYDEIVGAYAKKNTKISNNLLIVRKDGPCPVYTCGENPYFVAKVVTL